MNGEFKVVVNDKELFKDSEFKDLGWKVKQLENVGEGPGLYSIEWIYTKY